MTLGIPSFIEPIEFVTEFLENYCKPKILGISPDNKVLNIDIIFGSCNFLW